MTAELLEPTFAPQGTTVAKQQQSKPKKPKEKAFNLRFADEELETLIEQTADALGLDAANFLRMVVKENLKEYVARARRIREGDTA